MASGRLAALVANPRRVYDLARLRRNCERAAAASGWDPPLVLTTTATEAGAGLTTQALEAGAALVFAAGGDGTVSACAQALAGTGVPLAIVPAGSANLTAHALGVPTRTAAALDAGFRGRDRRIDLASADGKPFTAMAGIGLDAAVVGGTPDLFKQLAGWPAYAGAATWQLLRSPASFVVQIDDEPPLERRARCVAVGNCGSLPGGFPIMPDARLDDGVLDVAILAPAGALGWATVACRVLARSRHDDLQLERYRARRVVVRADADLPRQVDGEVITAGSTLAVAVQPGALLVRVPG